jgi:hypothetical protein
MNKILWITLLVFIPPLRKVSDFAELKKEKKDVVLKLDYSKENI